MWNILSILIKPSSQLASYGLKKCSLTPKQCSPKRQNSTSSWNIATREDCQRFGLSGGRRTVLNRLVEPCPNYWQLFLLIPPNTSLHFRMEPSTSPLSHYQAGIRKPFFWYFHGDWAPKTNCFYSTIAGNILSQICWIFLHIICVWCLLFDASPSFLCYEFFCRIHCIPFPHNWNKSKVFCFKLHIHHKCIPNHYSL